MRIIRFFDKLEDVVRGWFSHYPILYAVTGGVGIVLFWRGVWHTADLFSVKILALRGAVGTTDFSLAWWDGPLSFLVGLGLLLVTGLFVSNFIGNEIIISGLRGEKKLAEKTEAEVKTETGAIGEIQEELRHIVKAVDELAEKK